MDKLQSYEKLEVWKLSMKLVEEIYLVTNKFPKEELFVLTSQIRRAAISIPSNISEGSSRSKKDFARFLQISHGSCSELKTQIMIAKNIKYIIKTHSSNLIEKINQISRMIRSLENKIRGKND